MIINIITIRTTLLTIILNNYCFVCPSDITAAAFLVWVGQHSYFRYFRFENHNSSKTEKQRETVNAACC